MLTTVQVSCTLQDQDGTPIAGAIITAKLNGPEVDATNGYVMPKEVSGTADAQGKVTLALWPNALGVTESWYDVKWQDPRTGKITRIQATIPNGNCSLHTVANLPPYEGKPDGQLAIDAAAAYAVVATTHATEAAASAEAAAGSAVSASGSAGTATTKAAEAAGSANAANNSAISASGSAATATTKAGQAADSATAAAGSAASAASAVASAFASPPTIGSATPGAGNFSTLSANNNTVVTVNSTGAALKVSQTGTGVALLVEDQASTDASPFVIDSGGTVISGHTAPLQIGSTVPRIQVVGGDNSLSAMGLSRFSADSDRTRLYFAKSRSATPLGHAVLQSGDVIANLGFFGSDGAAFIDAARISVEVDGPAALNDMPGRMVFSTTPDGSASLVEALRLTSAQQVGIGGAPETGVTLQLAKNITGASTSKGLLHTGVIQPGTTTSVYYNQTFAQTAAASFNVADLIQYAATQGVFGAGSSVTRQVGFLVEGNMVGAATNYGFRGQIPAGANRYNLYMDGTADNYLAGSVGIGAIPQSTRSLNIGKDINGGTSSFGVVQNGTVQSAVTTRATGFQNSLNTAASSFTLGEYLHYLAAQVSIGAGSAITNQYGFVADSNMIGAANNYGFLGQIPAGAGRWNLYMNGTAANYMNGALLLGSTTNNGVDELQVTGTASVSGAVTVGGITSSGAVTLNNNTSVSVSSSGAAFRVTQTGTGPALLVEDSASTDGTPFVVDGSGNVAIGDTNPASVGAQLYLSHSTSGWPVVIARNKAADATSFQLIGDKERAGAAVQNGDQMLRLFARGYDGANYVNSAYIVAEVDGIPGPNDMPGRIVFGTTKDGTSVITEALRIDSAQRVALGGAAATSGSTFSVRKAITGNVTGIGIVHNGAVQPDVTAAVYGIRNDMTTAAASFTLNNYSHFYVSQQTIGAGSAVTTQIGYAIENTMIGATNNYGFFGNIPAGTGRYNLYMSGTADNYVAGSLGIGNTPNAGNNIRLSKHITGAAFSTGMVSDGQVQSDVTSRADYFLSVSAVAAGSYPTVNHYRAQQGTFTGTLTSQRGFEADSSLVGATNNYGFLGNIPAGGGRWNLYMAGTAVNYMAGSLWLGTGAPGAVRFANNLDITGGGGTAYANANNNVILSDVTNAATIYNTFPTTQAAAFTVGALNHYVAGQAALGAGSAITTQSGFVATSTLVGAGTNHGFRGDIPAGAGRYNLYMGGTADNYLAGSLGIGVTPSVATGVRIGRNLTGSASAYGVLNTCTVAADVTSDATMYRATADVASGASVTTLSGFSVTPGTFTGSVANNIGFYVASNLTGGTHNHAFRSDLNAGANRYNLYMGGTAINYLNGALLVGSSVDNGVDKLQVTGTVSISGDSLRLATAKTPASASAPGVQGQHCWDANYLYVCVATNTWKRVAIATW